VINIGTFVPWIRVFVLCHDASRSIAVRSYVNDHILVSLGALDTIEISVVKVVGLKGVAVLAVDENLHVPIMRNQSRDRLMVVVSESVNNVPNRVVKHWIRRVGLAGLPVVVVTRPIGAWVTILDDHIGRRNIGRKARIVIPRRAIACGQEWIEAVEG